MASFTLSNSAGDDKSKRCAKCGNSKPETEFRLRKSGLRWSYCRECEKKYLSDYGKRRPIEKDVEIDADWFWSKVNKSECGQCWEWTGTCSRKYGVFNIRSRVLQAHRTAYRLSKGEIPDGLQVLHKCDNPPCCNPSHLFLGTFKDNMDDKCAKNRQMGPRGELCALAKLTAADVSQIREVWANGGTIKGIARERKMSPSAIGQIVRRETWKHIA